MAKAIRNASISRCFIVAVMLLSWLVVTNHCALAQIHGPNGQHTHCHASKGASDNKAPGDGTRECCKAIKANLASQPELKFELSPLDLPGCVLFQALSMPAVIPVSAFLHDHGPPRVISFAENVLQRSLLSHAPPAFL